MPIHSGGGVEGKIKGTIKQIDSTSIFVKWDNERGNYYTPQDLELVKDTIEETIIKLTK